MTTNKKKRHVVIKTHVFRTIYMFTPYVITSVKLHPRCAVQLHSLEKRALLQFSATKLDTEEEILRASYQFTKIRDITCDKTAILRPLREKKITYMCIFMYLILSFINEYLSL